MKKIKLYGIMSVCLLLLSSCLGDSPTKISIGNQVGVVQIRPIKGIFIKNGELLCSKDIDQLSVDEGDCGTLSYSIDTSSPENSNPDRTYQTVENVVFGPIDSWPLLSTLTDTAYTSKEQREQFLTSFQARQVYIKGKYFLWMDRKLVANEKDSVSLSYDSEQPAIVDEYGRAVYDLYLRIYRKSPEVLDGETYTTKSVVNAFGVQTFFDKAMTQTGKDTVYVRLNYATGFNKDTTKCIWGATKDLYKIFIEKEPTK